MPLNPEFLNDFLNLFWLRPENAIFAAAQTSILDRHVIHKGKSIDLSCGDGTSSFILAGGKFDPKFDLFETTGGLDSVHKKNNDIFDHFSDSYKPPIIRPAKRKYDYALDIKESMLQKAMSLGLYEKSVLHDGSTKLPFENASFDTVYCLTALYHYENVEKFFHELKRILAPKGTAYITVITPAFISLYQDLDKNFSKEWTTLIERGMRDLWPSMFTAQKWEDFIVKAKLSVSSAIPIINKDFAPIWNVGLRPIAPFTIKMANEVRRSNPELFLEVKNDWVNFFKDLAAPFYVESKNIDSAGSILFVIKND